jgi:hypothetical protein
LWEITQRLEEYKERRIITRILYLGDHDCSGVVIDKKVAERLRQFGAYASVERIALTFLQAKEYKIPGTPAKTKSKDKNYKKYVEKYGDLVWEIEGLPPDVIYNLVIDKIKSYLDIEKYNKRIKRQDRERKELKAIIDKLNF